MSLQVTQLIIALSLFSCTGMDEEVHPLPVSGSLAVQLTTQAFEERGTVPAPRTASLGGALTRAQELKVEDLWCFEFDGTQATSKLTAMKQIDRADLVDMQHVTLRGISANDIGHTVCLMANLNTSLQTYLANGAIKQGVTTQAELQGLTFEWNNYHSQTGTDFTLPMTGSFVVRQLAAGETQEVTLNRRVARVNVSVTDPESKAEVTLLQLALSNVPKTSAFVTPTTASYPAADKDNFTETVNDVKNYCFYIPENKRSAGDELQTLIRVGGVVVGKEQFDYAVPFNATPNEVRANTEYNVMVDASKSEATITELSLHDCANCYIVNRPNSLYRFRADIQGNGVGTELYKPVALTTGEKAFTLWSMGGDTEQGLNGVVTDVSYDQTTRKITFHTVDNAANGNAVIALADSEGTILWTWHIWRVDYDPYTDYDSYTLGLQASVGTPEGTPSPLDMMKFNLGTTNTANFTASAPAPGELGFFYQWGRKDPFLGAANWTETNDTRYQNVCKSGYEWKDGVEGRENIVYADKIGANNLAEAIAYTVQHPTTFLKSQSSPYDWSDKEHDGSLWGNDNTANGLNPKFGYKSCFDPCPPGWRVPPEDTWEAAGTRKYTRWDSKGYWVQYDMVHETFYPALGDILRYDPKLLYVGTWGGYWTSSSGDNSGSSKYKGARLRFASYSFESYTDNTGERAVGHNVRCCRE